MSIETMVAESLGIDVKPSAIRKAIAFYKSSPTPAVEASLASLEMYRTVHSSPSGRKEVDRAITQARIALAARRIQA